MNYVNLIVLMFVLSSPAFAWYWRPARVIEIEYCDSTCYCVCAELATAARVTATMQR